MKSIKTIVFALVLVILTPGIAWSLDNEDMLKMVLSEVEAKAIMIDITDWSVINREFMDFSSMEENVDTILDLFKTSKQNFNVTKDFDEIYRIVNTEGLLDSDTFLQITIQSVLLPEEYEKKPQTYLTVSISSLNTEKLGDFLSKVRESIILSNGTSKITSCVTGTFDGRLDGVNQDQIIDKITEYLKVNDIQKVMDRYTYSVMGQSPLFSEGVKILDKNYNVNIAMRYNSEDDITYIWIGTPVISIEY